MIRPAGRKCLSCGKKMRPLVAVSGWASSDFALDYCTLKCVRNRPLPKPPVLDLMEALKKSLKAEPATSQ